MFLCQGNSDVKHVWAEAINKITQLNVSPTRTIAGRKA